jgi:alpha-mannosidase
MAKKAVMHVISGTHWDREWRHTAEQSKPRLVELVDSMMETLEKRPDYKSYVLDGGLVVVEDYLTVKPENRERLKALIQAGRIQLVNWYTLPDMFTVAPEAILRNIKLGQMMAREFGKPISAGYTATSYGQTSQLPQIYQGFGITNAIFYRGTNRYLLKPLFSWEGIDGTRLHMLRTFDEVTRTNWFFYVHQPLVVGKPPRDLSHTYERDTVPVHLCDEQLYERAFRLLKETPGFKKDAASLKAALELILNQARPYAVGKHLLALNMEDNDVPFILLPDMIAALNAVSPDVQIVQSTLDEYMQQIIRDTPAKDLPVHKGELRYTVVEANSFNGLLGATHSSRIKLKLLNEAAETRLIFGAEPLSSFDTLLGGDYPKNFLDRAWRHLLLNQAHDSICGAAVDQAHDDMLYNFSIAQRVAEEITARSAVELFKRIDTATDFREEDHTITLFNTLSYARRQVVPLVIDLPRKAAGGSAIIDPCTGVGATEAEVNHYDIVDAAGLKLDYKELSREKIEIAVERELDTKGIRMPATRRRVLVEVTVPAMGYATVALRPRDPNLVKHPVPGPDRALLARENGVLENEHVKVTIHSNGTFALLHKATGRLMDHQHYFTDNGEIGSAHISRMPQRNPVQTSLGSVATITMVECNTLRGIYRIDLSLTIPAAATLDGRDRLRETRVIPLTTWLTLEKGSPVLKLRTKLTNDARDHRLRVNFPSYVKSDYATVESAYAVEKRDIRWTVTGDNGEGHYPFQPMQNFVDVNDGKVGLAVLNKGLREYEVRDDADRTIVITLLRTQRAYMTANAEMIPDEFDKYTGLHSFGTLEYNYALYPHTGDWDAGQVLQKAYDHKAPFVAIQGVTSDGGHLPSSGSFFAITPADKLMVSAIKQADEGKGIILRLWNTSGKSLNATVTTTLPVKSAARLRLDETPLGKLAVKGGKIAFKCEPHKIITLLLENDK